MAATKSILKNGTYSFGLAEWGTGKDVTIQDGFTQKAVNTYQMNFRATHNRPEDCEAHNPEDPASVTVTALFDPATGTGIEKPARVQGDSTMPWQAFADLFEATGADSMQMGKPVYRDGRAPGEIMMSVRAVPSNGNFAPKNVLESWRTPEKAKQAASVFTAALKQRTTAQPNNAMSATLNRTAAPTSPEAPAASKPPTRGKKATQNAQK